MKPYKDEKGDELFGFSQVSLDELNKKLERANKITMLQTKVYGAAIFILIAVILWVIWQVKKYQIVSLLLGRLGGC